MRIGVFYGTMTWNTRKVADTIAKELGTKAGGLSSASIKDMDIIVLGTGVYAYGIHPAMKKFLTRDDLKGKKVAIFVTWGVADTGTEIMKKALEEKGATVIDSWNCKCMVPFKGPSEEDLKKAVEFAKRISK